MELIDSQIDNSVDDNQKEILNIDGFVDLTDLLNCFFERDNCKGYLIVFWDNFHYVDNFVLAERIGYL